jgi:ABC-2 type transport system permease protein
MWFSSVFLKTLRDSRIAILGWGVGMGLLTLEVQAAVSSLVATPAARAELMSLTSEFSWNAEGVAVDTVGGYLTWKVGFFILLIALWPLLAGTRTLRGEEERGSLDMLLSLPRGRLRVALEKVAALWIALLMMGVLIGLLTFAGGAAFNADYSVVDALLFGLNLVLICGVFGSIALLVSQFTQERGTAAGVAGGLLVFFIALDMVHRVIPNTEWVSRLSPVYYYNLSKPVIPSYGVNPGAMLVMLGLSVLLSGAAIWLFARRDVGAPVLLPRWLRPPERAVSLERALPVNAWSLRSVYARGLAKLVVPTLWWTLGLAGFAAWVVVIAQQIGDKLQDLANSSSFMRDLIVSVGGSNNLNAAILSFMFLLLPLLLMAFAITQANHWAADEEEGRQELILSTPQSRLTVLLARFGALTTATVFIGVATLALTALSAAASGLTLDGGKLAAATLSIIPLGLLVAALGYLFAGWVHTAVDTGLLSFLLVIWFFISFVGPDLNLPDAVQQFSALHYYGNPLLNGLPVGDMLLVLAVTVVALALAALRFARKDIGR